MPAAAMPKPRTDLYQYPKYWAECYGTTDFLPTSRAEMDVLGWEPGVELEEGLGYTVEFFRGL